MDFTLTDLHKQYRSEIIKFSREHLNDNLTFDSFSREKWGKISNFGLLGICADDKFGGLAENYLTSAIAMEALGYSCKDNDR